MDNLKENLLNNVDKCNTYKYNTLSQRNLVCIIATICFFMLEGLFAGLWSVSLVDLQKQLNLSNSLLGYAVFCTFIGTLVIIPISSVLFNKLGCKYRLFIFSLIFCLVYSHIPLSNSITIFFIISFVYGLVWGILDITANQSAILTEIISGSTLLGYYHGSYSLSASIGSIIGGLLKSYELTLINIFLIFTIFGCILTILSHIFLYDIKQELCIELYNKVNAENNELLIQTNVIQKNHKWNIIYLCTFSFIASFGESSITLLCGLFYDKVLNTSKSLATIGFSCFMIAMAVGRFTCEYLHAKYGKKMIFFTFSFLVNVGLIIVLLSSIHSNSKILLASIGFTITGFGLSIIIPLTYSIAGKINIKIYHNSILTIVAFSSYSGFIMSAPIIGHLSDYYGSIIYGVFFDLFIVSLLIPISILMLKEF